MAAEFGTLECDNCGYGNIDQNLPMIEGQNCPRCGNGRMQRRQQRA